MIGVNENLKDSLSIKLYRIEVRNVIYSKLSKSNDLSQFYYPQEITLIFELVYNTIDSIKFVAVDSIIGFDKYYSIGAIRLDSVELDLYVANLRNINRRLLNLSSSNSEFLNGRRYFFQTHLITDVSIFKYFHTRTDLKAYFNNIEYGNYSLKLTKNDSIFDYNYRPNGGSLIIFLIDSDTISMDSIGLESYGHLDETRIRDFHVGSW